MDFSGENEFPTSMNDVFPKFNENLERIKAGQPVSQKKKQEAVVSKSAPAPAPSQSNLKSEGIFSMMDAYIALGEAKPLIPKVAAVYNFNITLKKGGAIQKTWIIDLKNDKGAVRVGTDKNADATFTMTDNDFE